MTLERGTLLHKRYRIVEILGQGGMGSVYRAVDENLGVDVAVKENLFTTDEYSRQFRLEAVILASLRHPNLPRVSDHFAVGDQGQYLIMDFIEGEDLRQRMERMGTVTEDDAVMVGAAMCDALAYLHTRKPSILHRDIKPGNVKITPEGNIYLVDFGLAKLVQGTQATTTGARAMTPGYSPPEQYGTARTDPRTDIYSLGATLYAALTGMIPEDGLARAMDNAQLTSLRKRNPKVSRRLAAAIEKAMAVDPADRYQTAEEFKKALLSARSHTERVTGEFTVSPPPGQTAGSNGGTAVRHSPTPRSAESPLPVFAEDQSKPFVPPGKRRRRSPVPMILLFALIIGGAGIFILYPNDLYPSLRASLPPIPYLAFAMDPTATPTDKPTATLAAFTATVQPTVAFTFTPLPTKTPLPTPTAIPALGGGSGEIAFASDRSGVPEIYLSDLASNEAKLLINMPEGACEPAWSPDGSQIIFVSPCNGPLDLSDLLPDDTKLYIANADGSEPTAVNTDATGDSEPAWSPDGKRIAFTSVRDGQPLIYTINLENNEVTRLIEPSADFAAVRQPAWSKAGDQIVFAAKNTKVDGVYQIWTVTDSGQGLTQIVLSGTEYSDYLPTWSPDGKTITFSQRLSPNAPNPTVLPWVMKILYENRGKAGDPVKGIKRPIEHFQYSPDGKWYAFEAKYEGNNIDIYYSPISGETQTQLTHDPGRDFDPAWRPLP
jgi:serine/threonine protein kinase/Tol biopolymer transport system component